MSRKISAFADQDDVSEAGRRTLGFQQISQLVEKLIAELIAG